MATEISSAFEETGSDRTFAFKTGAGVTKISDFSTGTNSVGKLTRRQALWVCYSSGDANTYVYLVPRSKGDTAPTIDAGSAQGYSTRLAVGSDQMIHVKANGDLYAFTDSSVANAVIRVIEV